MLINPFTEALSDSSKIETAGRGKHPVLTEDIVQKGTFEKGPKGSVVLLWNEEANQAMLIFQSFVSKFLFPPLSLHLIRSGAGGNIRRKTSSTVGALQIKQ